MQIEPIITTESNIRAALTARGRGNFFFLKDFKGTGTPENIRQSLSTLAKDRTLMRVARGIYYYPPLTGEHGYHPVPPSTEDIVNAVAERYSIRIVPFGDSAAYLLGLTTISTDRYTYLTDGAPKKLMAGKHMLTFRHSSEMRIFEFVNTQMQLLSLAIRAIGKDYLSTANREKIADIIRKIPAEEFEHDVNLCPGWVADIIREL